MTGASPSSRILVAGIGNIFLGDDAFGVEVAQRLAGRPWPEGVQVVDFGIRGFDLAYAMLGDYDVTILVDATRQGGKPGSLYLIEADLDEMESLETAEIETHGMDPAKVLRLVRQLGGRPRRVLVVGCEPETFGVEGIGQMALSPAVQSAVGEAEQVIDQLVQELCQKLPLQAELNLNGTLHQEEENGSHSRDR
jgi:hydrogenase maturation protease